MTRIAVVDDNVVSQRFFREVFAERAWEVVPWHSAEDVHAALSAAQPVHADLIVLDLHLPERNRGLEVLQLLKAHAVTHDIPVILSSGDVWSLQSLSDSTRANVAAVLVKPFDIEQAHRSVEYVLRQAGHTPT